MNKGVQHKLQTLVGLGVIVCCFYRCLCVVLLLFCFCAISLYFVGAVGGRGRGIMGVGIAQLIEHQTHDQKAREQTCNLKSRALPLSYIPTTESQW